MNKRFFSISSILLLSALAAVANGSKLNVLDPQGKKVGTGTFTLTKAATKVTMRIVLNMSEQGAKLTMDMSDSYSPSGNPLSQVMKMSATAQGNSFTSTTTVSYSGKKATLKTTAMGKTSTKSATSPGPIADASVAWISGKIPAVGTSSTYYRFDPLRGEWEKNVNTYHGLRNVKIGQRTVSAHVMSTKSADDNTKVYFTKSGDLVKLESKEFTLVQQ